MVCRTYNINELHQYKYVVILSKYNGKILLSRHKERTTWETQGGHIEVGESPMEAAKRELYEESGAIGFLITPLCDYWAGNPVTNQGANGMVFVADIYELGEMPKSEMAEIRTFDILPENLTYPSITPNFFAKMTELDYSNELENEFILDLHDYQREDSVYKRTAVRGMIQKDGKYLLIHSKYGDHKFPGGGVKKGESFEQALVREVQEETGYIVKADSISKEFIVHEKRKGQQEDLMKMDSHYFICDVYDETMERNLDAYEAEYEYEICWMTLEEAISKNESIEEYNVIPWTKRETMMMKARNNKE